MDNKELFIDTTIGGLTALLGSVNPVLGIASGALAPIVANAAKNMLPEVLGDRERNRLEFVFTRSVEKIKYLIGQNKMPRNDDAYYDSTYSGIPNAQEILEGVLLKAREEFQSKKLECYSSFFANLCFDETIHVCPVKVPDGLYKV